MATTSAPTINISGGKITGSTSSIFSNTSSSTINISGGNIYGAAAEDNAVVNTIGTLNITGGTISSTGSIGVIVRENGKATISGDAVIQKSGTIAGATLQISGTALAELNGGTIKTLEGCGSRAIYNSGTGSIKVKGATVEQLGFGVAGTNASTGTIEFVSGTITSKEDSGLTNESTGTIIIGANDGTVLTTNPVITGKTYGVYVGSGKLYFYDGVIKGATAISGEVADWPDGYCVKTTTADGIETAVLDSNVIATTSSRGYASLAEAMEGAAVTDTVKMLANSEETKTATVASGKDITLDLGGQTVSYSGINGIENAGTLTVVGSGKLTDDIGHTINNTGTLNINANNENGIVENSSPENAYTAINNYGTLNINSGIVVNSAKAETTASTWNPFVIRNRTGATTNINGGIVKSISSGLTNQFGIWTGGILNIAGGTIEAVGTTIFNSSNGFVKITDGTIISTQGCALYNNSSSANEMTIGSNDGTVSTTSPTIIGKTNGIIVGPVTLNFYDGVIKGATAISGEVTGKPTGYKVSTTTTDGTETAILVKE